MKYEFYSTQEFIKELKTLSKKYKSLKDDVKKLQEEFVANPNLGISFQRLPIQLGSQLL